MTKCLTPAVDILCIFLNPNEDCLMDLFKINVKRKMMVPI